MSATNPSLTWKTDLPLFSRVMLVQWSGAMLGTGIAAMVILTTIFIGNGEWNGLGAMAMVIAAVIGALWVLGLSIMAVLFRGRFHVRYTLDDRGIRYESLESLVRGANRAAVVAGALARSPGVAGAGWLAASRESEEIRWKGAFKAVYRPGARVILLRNSWRTLMWVQCKPDNFELVAAAVEQHMARRQPASRLGTRSTLPRYLLNTLIVSLGCVPLFSLAGEFDTGLFMPVFIYCFALAMVWMIPLFAYAVIGGLGIEIVLLLADLTELRESSLLLGEPYRGFEVISDSEAVALMLACLGAALLILMSWRYLTGRSDSALIADKMDMAGS